MPILASLFIFYLISCFPSFSYAQNDEIMLPLKAVNLGNWLVTEGWMEPSLFDEIPNNEFLDGTQIQLMSTKLNKYLSAENGGGELLVANRPSASDWETFRLWRVDESHFKLRVAKKQFVGIGSNVVQAVSNTETESETFQIVRNGTLVHLKASTGSFLQAQSEILVTADYENPSWDQNDPSVFNMTIPKTLRGEYQITSGYGPDKAPQVMNYHWNTYITEEDFKFMSTHGVNAVRIPVGWWIASDPMPPKPFVGGSSTFLDKAFTWAEQYEMKVILDLHALNASQNGNDHSGTRDGYLEWGDSNIDETVRVIENLAEKYGGKPSLAAIELMNEPGPGVDLEALKKYYKAGYEAVRKHTTRAYVILSNRLGIEDQKELLPFARSFPEGVVIDVHYYNLYNDDLFKTKGVQGHIDYINQNRSADLAAVSSPEGPLVFVGEWTAAFDSKDTRTEEDYKSFMKAQLDVYGRATFGWGYWAYKCTDDNSPWSLKWMIEHNGVML